MRLYKNNRDMHDLLVDYYVFGMTLRVAGSRRGVSHSMVLKQLQNAEGVVEGMLMALNVTLEMDRYVQREPVGAKFPPG